MNIEELGKLTMSAVRVDQTTHAHLRRTLKQPLGHDPICLGYATEAAGDREDAVVDAGNDFADPSTHTSLVAQVGNILASFANDNPSFLGGDNGTEGELLLRVLFLGALDRILLLIVSVDTTKGLGELGDIRRSGGVVVFTVGRHGGRSGG